MKIEINLVAKRNLSALFCISKNIIKILINFFNCISARRVERHSNHRADFAQINFDCCIVISTVLWLELLVSSNTAVNCIPLFYFTICFPDRRKTGCFSSHYINTDTEISRKICNTWSNEFHYLVLYKAACKYFFNDCKCNVLRTNSRNRSACKVNCNNARIVYIISFSEELLSELPTTLTNCHSTKGTVTSVAVRTKNHSTTFSKHFACILVNYSLVWRNINSTVFLCTCQTKHVVVIIDCTAYSTK